MELVWSQVYIRQRKWAFVDTAFTSLQMQAPDLCVNSKHVLQYQSEFTQACSSWDDANIEPCFSERTISNPTLQSQIHQILHSTFSSPQPKAFKKWNQFRHSATSRGNPAGVSAGGGDTPGVLPPAGSIPIQLCCVATLGSFSEGGTSRCCIFPLCVRSLSVSGHSLTGEGVQCWLLPLRRRGKPALQPTPNQCGGAGRGRHYHPPPSNPVPKALDPPPHPKFRHWLQVYDTQVVLHPGLYRSMSISLQGRIFMSFIFKERMKRRAFHYYNAFGFGALVPISDIC